MRAASSHDPSALLAAALAADARPGSRPGRPEWTGWSGATFAERTTPGGDARVWSVHLAGANDRVVTGDGRAGAPAAFLKRHRSARKYRQEVAALRSWAPALAPDAPQLLARDDTALVLLTTAVGGTPLDALDLDRPAAVAAYRALGDFTRRLHALPNPEDDPMPPAEAYRLRVTAWCDGAAGRVDAATIGDVRAFALEAEAALGSARRVPCHRDLAPRNVLVAGAARVGPAGESPPTLQAPQNQTTLSVGVIDFEHARADLRWFDLVRLQAEVWHDRPELKEAFFDTWRERSAWTGTDEAILARCVALHALATTAWAARHGDARLEACGRRLLDRVARDR
jgi:hypothetical protein